MGAQLSAHRSLIRSVIADARVVFGRSEFDKARSRRVEAEAFAALVQEQNRKEEKELMMQRDEMYKSLEQTVNSEDIRRAIDLLKKAERERETRPDGLNSAAVVKELKKILEKEKWEEGALDK